MELQLEISQVTIALLAKPLVEAQVLVITKLTVHRKAQDIALAQRLVAQ